MTTVLAVLVGLLVACGDGADGPVATPAPEPSTLIPLPPPATESPASLEETLAARRSAREYAPEPLSLAELGQLLWAGQGVTEPGGAGRTAPSAGGTYPLEVYALTAEGLFQYQPGAHMLAVLGHVDLRPELAAAALGQEWVRAGAAVLVLVGVTARTAQRYGERAERYVTLEAGHAAQNVLLQATALGLAAVPVGAFDDARVQSVLGLPADWTPLYLIPVGRPAGG